MTQSATLISSEVDIDREGKQTGFLRLSHSVHRSAYGALKKIGVLSDAACSIWARLTKPENPRPTPVLIWQCC